MAPAPMPKRYIAEMVMDRIAACKVYLGEDYSDDAPLQYFRSGKDPAPIHEFTRNNLEMLLTMLSNLGEKQTFKFIKKEFLLSHFGGEENKIQ